MLCDAMWCYVVLMWVLRGAMWCYSGVCGATFIMDAYVVHCVVVLVCYVVLCGATLCYVVTMLDAMWCYVLCYVVLRGAMWCYVVLCGATWLLCGASGATGSIWCFTNSKMLCGAAFKLNGGCYSRDL
ncbi:hypothetical protein BV898_19601 [Hypsibius exemplaris]|uniref:Uncharacterized protein n=1 Tax=Hypsibius exemplaris TaxID=2072580 RepID=A0A9X6NLS4_HYPEX|nr:hypothetical protein BV898_19601 [Hypsibius exemplaris]